MDGPCCLQSSMERVERMGINSSVMSRVLMVLLHVLLDPKAFLCMYSKHVRRTRAIPSDVTCNCNTRKQNQDTAAKNGCI